MRLRKESLEKTQAPVQALIFLGFLFLTAQVASIAAMIIFPLILHPAVHVYDYHIFITSHSLIVDIKEKQV